MKRITLPNGRQCTLAAYVRAWRTLKSMNPEGITAGFGHFPETAGEVLEQLRAGVHDRINRHDRSFGVGRKWSSDWYRAALQCAHRVNTPRLIVRTPEIPFDLRGRLSHRIYTE